jgi:hypothetical protein
MQMLNSFLSLLCLLQQQTILCSIYLPFLSEMERLIFKQTDVVLADAPPEVVGKTLKDANFGRDKFANF